MKFHYEKVTVFPVTGGMDVLENIYTLTPDYNTKYLIFRSEEIDLVWVYNSEHIIKVTYYGARYEGEE